jgi:hypothetical protein
MRALQAALERLHRRNVRLAQLTLSGLAEEYLAQHEAEPRTIIRSQLDDAAVAQGARGLRQEPAQLGVRSARGGRRCLRGIASRRPRRYAKS